MTCGRAGLILVTIIFSFGYAERKKRPCPLRTWLAVRGACPREEKADAQNRGKAVEKGEEKWKREFAVRLWTGMRRS